MTPATWTRHLTAGAWDRLLAVASAEYPDKAAQLAAVLTEAQELGWRAPEVAPRFVDPKGDRVVWPGADGAPTGVLTAQGLAAFYKARGHRFFLLRMDVLIRAVGGPLMPWFQSMLAAYHEAIEDEALAAGKPPQLFGTPVLDVSVFVGGDGNLNDRDPQTVVEALIGPG